VEKNKKSKTRRRTDVNLDDASIQRLRHGTTKVTIPLPQVRSFLYQLGNAYFKYVAAAEAAVAAAKERGLRGTAAKLYATKHMHKTLNEESTPDYMPWRYKSLILELVYIVKSQDN